MISARFSVTKRFESLLIAIVAQTLLLSACRNSGSGNGRDASTIIGNTDGSAGLAVDGATDERGAEAGPGPVDVTVPITSPDASTDRGDTVPIDIGIPFDTLPNSVPDATGRPGDAAVDTLSTPDVPTDLPAPPDSTLRVDTDHSSDVADARVFPDAAADKVKFDAADVPQPPPPPPASCSPAGATECTNASTLRTCMGGTWVQTACGAFQACSAGACRDGCPGLVAPSGASVACYMPVNAIVGTDGLIHTTKTISTDPVGVPAPSFPGDAFDSLDQNPPSMTAAPVVTDPLGLIWQTPSPTTADGRIYLIGGMNLGAYKAKYGSGPGAISLYVKMRKLVESGHSAPEALFSVYDGQQNGITVVEDDTQLQPATDWAIYSRMFASAEIASLSLDGTLNVWNLLFEDILSSTPPENVEVAWFALAFVPIGEGSADAGVNLDTGNGPQTDTNQGTPIDCGASVLDAASVDSIDATSVDTLSGDDSTIASADSRTGDAIPCTTPGAMECVDMNTLRTCTNGVWVESSCGDFQLCSAGACRTGCPDLSAPSGAIVACYMPFDGPSTDGNTTGMMTSEPTGMPGPSAPAWALDEQWNDVPAVEDSIGPIWSTSNWLSPQGFMEFTEFEAKYGGAPKAIALYIKMRVITNPNLLAPDPWFLLLDGDYNIVAYDQDTASLMPTTNWAIYSRTFTSDEIGALSMDGNYNSWQLNFYADPFGPVPSTPPENVQVAWFALTFVPPN